jgi:hypothetical protein
LRDSHMWLKRDAGCTGTNSAFKYRQFHTLQVKCKAEFRMSLIGNIIRIPYSLRMSKITRLEHVMDIFLQILWKRSNQSDKSESHRMLDN